MVSSVFGFAAIMSSITWCVHTFVGQKYVVVPLLAVPNAHITRASRWINYYTWHVTTLIIIVIGGCFIYAAISQDGRPFAVLATGMCGAFSALCFAVGIKSGIPPLRLPAFSLFTVTGLVGLLGLLL